MRHTIQKFAKNQAGTAAIEFASLAIPFISLFIVIFQVSIILYEQELLQTATSDVARKIMTGQVQSQGLSQPQFKQLICNEVSPTLNCSNLYLNVQPESSFSSTSFSSPIVNQTFQTSSMGYNPGGADDIIAVQAFYQQSVVSAPMGFNVADLQGGAYLISATSIFKNEPF